tara:strand:+ start:757 stop:1683 length:927 start_codon:yes stop_codon:yes gene_type:complete
MLNTHIEHPEDTILTGNLDFLHAVKSYAVAPHGHVSVKIDGAPAIVWGTHPDTGRFFVGTKSVFNKKLIKINYTHKDIDNNHTGYVAIVLHACLSNLPKTTHIYQGDFLGFGGESVFQPNTVTYVFPENVEQTIIVAPHTQYEIDQFVPSPSLNALRDTIAIPLYDMLDSTEKTFFYQPIAIMSINDSLRQRVDFAMQVAQMVKFVDDSEAKLLKNELNQYIREGRKIDSNDFGDYNLSLIGFYNLIMEIKEELLSCCKSNQVALTLIEGEECDGEGYVFHSGYGSYKLVDRRHFSYYNFNLERGWVT